MGIKHGDKIFYLNGPWGRSLYDKFNDPNWAGWSRDEVIFGKWCRGETGYPFIDAAMTELNFVAGVGFDRGAPRKYFSQFRYAALHDKEGLYVKRWLPRMCTVSRRFIHKPWLMGAHKQKINRLLLGTDYFERCA